MGKSSEALGQHATSDVAVPHSNNPFRRFMGSSRDQHDSIGTSNGSMGYAPPPGPPPGRDTKSNGDSVYTAPPGPPPSHPQSYAPPPGPPPSSHTDDEPPPPAYDAWLSVPDTSLLPPPPSLSNDTSPTANAPAELSDLAKTWCRANPLSPSTRLSTQALQAISSGTTALLAPPGGRVTVTCPHAPGTYHVTSRRQTQDTCLRTAWPLYSATHHHPPSKPDHMASATSTTSQQHTAYFEVKFLSAADDSPANSGDEVTAAIALGYVAGPYPGFRLPGWERASLGVHGDDGRRYVCDDRGGRDFTTWFRPGETLGLGMRWATPTNRFGDPGKLKVEVFFTRDGKKEAGWDLWEERDQGDVDEGVGDPYGLGGDRDVFGAVGLFGAVEFEYRGRRDEWLHRPDLHHS